MAVLPILKADTADIPEKILVVGDPARVDAVNAHLDEVREISLNREYRTASGVYNGVKVGIVSHGVGSAGAGACFEELCQSGATRIVRAGSAGGMQKDVSAGSIVIATAAVREDGLSHKLVPPTYPAIASHDVLAAMRASAKSLGFEYHEGLLLTSDLFYPHDVLGSDLPLWQRAGVTAVEMECATLFVICSLHGVETGAVLAIDGNPMEQDEGSMETYDPHQASVKDAVEKSILIALNSLTLNA
jgi:uridine phosphorylase